MDGCQGKKNLRIREKTCPNCGAEVELLPGEACVQCGECGFTVFSDLMDCVQHCPQARQCVGEESYQKLIAAKEKWRQQMREEQDEDAW